MPFRFPLAALQKLRSLLEQQRQAALELVVAEQRRQQHRLQVADEIRTSYNVELRRELGSGISGSELHWSGLRLEAYESARAQAEKELQELDRVRVKRTESYLAAHKDSEIVQQIRTDMFAQYAREVQKREQNMIDSLHLARIVRDKLTSRRQREELPAQSH